MFTPGFSSDTSKKASPAPQAIFCCASAAPVITDSAYKIHNDPNRDFHDEIFGSFMAFVFRTQHQALLTALIHRHLFSMQKMEIRATGDSSLPLPSTSGFYFDSPRIIAGHQTPLNPPVSTSTSTPPFTPNQPSARKGKDKEIFWQDCENRFWLGFKAEQDLKAFELSSTQQKSIFSSLFSASVASLPSKLTDSAPTNAVITAPTTPDPIASAPVHPAAATSILLGSSHPAPFPSAASFSSTGVHDHVMVIPKMPHPLHPTEELLNSPLTPDVPYVIHLTSRHDYGPVYSHRYFACPTNLGDDWTEISLLQWFAQGEPFKMKAEKWDIKCENDSRFFRMTLRPNLNMRVTE